MLSDDSTSDSDTGIRFKTDSTRRPTKNDEESSKNRKSGDQRRDSSRHRDSGRNYSSRRSPPRRRDRSPLRDDKYSKDRHKSEYDVQKSFYDKDRGTKDSASRDANKPSSREERSRLDDKKLYECRVSSKTIKIDAFDSSKDRRSDLGRLSYKSSKDHDRQISRNTENLNKHSSKRDKYSPNEFDENNYHGNGKIAKIVEREERTNARSESPLIGKRSNSKDHKNDFNEFDKRKRHDESLNNVSPVEKRLSDTSDNEHKPISYYNMISTTYDNNVENDETIAVSDSSEDEEALRKQLSLLEHELKKTKSKKKSKHRDKRKCAKSSKSQKSGVSTDDDYKSQESNAISVDDKSNGDESNEEGEIISDSDEKSSRNDLRARLDKQKKLNSNNKHELPDLRDRLSSKSNLLEQNNAVMSPSQKKIEDSANCEDGEVEGPALPPHMLKTSNTTKNIGPSLPEHLRKKLLEDSERSSNAKVTVDEIQISDDDDDAYGPVPENSEKTTISHRRLEERALKMKIDSLVGDKTNEQQKDGREEWMLKLPDAKAKHLGLTSRQFRAREGPDLSDRSSWTDTPEEKALKASGIDLDKDKVSSEKLLENAELEFIQQRDAEQEMIAKKHKKKSKRKESLLDIHQKKLKKKKKKEDKEETVRRPFSRDIDLKANRFDDAQKKAIIKKAQLLDSRFSRGESKFL